LLDCVRVQVSYWSKSRPDELRGELIVSGDVVDAVLCDLRAGFDYRIQLAAATSAGYGPTVSLDTWTEISMPEKPPKPRVNATGYCYDKRL